MIVHPLVIVFVSLLSILMDYRRYRKHPFTPFWTYAARFFLPPLYLIYFYAYIDFQTIAGNYNAVQAAPYARVGFILFLMPNVILAAYGAGRWLFAKAVKILHRDSTAV